MFSICTEISIIDYEKLNFVGQINYKCNICNLKRERLLYQFLRSKTFSVQSLRSLHAYFELHLMTATNYTKYTGM